MRGLIRRRATGAPSPIAAALAIAAAMAIAASFALPAPLAAQSSPARASEPIAAGQALVTFDSAWSRIRASHYDTAMNGVDWNAVRDSLRPRAAAAATMGELRSVITAMLATLRESHFVLIPQEAADAVDPSASRRASSGQPGDVGVTLRLVGDTVVVSAVRAGSPAARAGVRPGWAVDSVDRFGAAAALTALRAGGVTRRQLVSMVPAAAMARLAGNAGSSVPVVFRDGHDRPLRRTLVREARPGLPVRFGNLPTLFVEVGHEVRPLGAGRGCAGIIRLSVWMLPATAQLDSAVDAVRHCDGIVIDIRGNPGGVGGMVMGFGGHFLDSSRTLGELRTRGNTMRFVANPRRVNTRNEAVTPFAGPLAILVDSLSMSTSEIFAAGMQATGRARIFGENTPGLALPAMATRLPDGDVMMHVFADFTDPKGVRIEGRGTVPDVLVPLTRRNLLAGRDAPLDAALAWIAGRAGEEEPVGTSGPARSAP